MFFVVLPLGAYPIFRWFCRWLGAVFVGVPLRAYPFSVSFYCLLIFVVVIFVFLLVLSLVCGDFRRWFVAISVGVTLTCLSGLINFVKGRC